MKNIPVSIIIPMYNCEAYINRCVKSIKEQTYAQYEAIIIDDGSTDSSIFICQKAVGNDPRFKIIHKNNTGVSDTRNYGLSLANGQNILFIDADDWVGRTYLSDLINEKRTSGADIICSGYYISDGFKKQKKFGLISKNLSINEALDGFSQYYFTAVWGKLFDKRVLKSVRFDTNIFYSEDTLFYTEAVLNSNLIRWINKANYYYFKNYNGVMKNRNPKRYITEFIARKKIVDLQKAAGINTYGVEYRLLDAAVNVKINLYRYDFTDDIILKEIDMIIEKYKHKYLRQYRTQIKIWLLKFPFILKTLK